MARPRGGLKAGGLIPAGNGLQSTVMKQVTATAWHPARASDEIVSGVATSRGGVYQSGWDKLQTMVRAN